MTRTSTVYSGRTTNWPAIAATVVLAAALVVLSRGWRGPWPGMLVPVAVLLLILLVVLLTATSLRVTTGPAGVRARFGPIGWPRFDYPRERIAAIEVVQVSIWTTWNWGLSWSPRRGVIVLLRSGPALQLTLTNGRRVTVGVPDAAAAVAALA